MSACATGWIEETVLLSDAHLHNFAVNGLLVNHLLLNLVQLRLLLNEIQHRGILLAAPKVGVQSATVSFVRRPGCRS